MALGPVYAFNFNEDRVIGFLKQTLQQIQGSDLDSFEFGATSAYHFDRSAANSFRITNDLGHGHQQDKNNSIVRRNHYTDEYSQTNDIDSVVNGVCGSKQYIDYDELYLFEVHNCW